VTPNDQALDRWRSFRRLFYGELFPRVAAGFYPFCWAFAVIALVVSAWTTSIPAGLLVTVFAPPGVALLLVFAQRQRRWLYRESEAWRRREAEALEREAQGTSN
jgi:membrane protein implicated in regulation of membrane protease activity